MDLDREIGLRCDVVLVDPDRLFREALADLLGQSGFEVLRTAASTRELEDGPLWRSESRERLFIINMTEGIAELRERLPRLVPAAEVKLVGISRAPTRERLHLALELGFNACLTKDTSLASFLKCVRLVLSGGSAFPFRLAQTLWTEPDPKAVPSGDNLTTREHAVLGHLARGASNKMIARYLGISDATVKVRLKSLFRKLGIRNRTMAAAWAVRMGILADGGAPESLAQMPLGLAETTGRLNRGVPRMYQEQSRSLALENAHDQKR